MSQKIQKTDTLEWNVDEENSLLDAMIGHKPVGVNRHFMMVSIHDKFSKSINKQVSSKCIWEHLDTMYNMAALHKSAVLPFPNEEVEFELGAEFDVLAKERLGISLPHSEKHPDIKDDCLKFNSSKPKENFSCPMLGKGSSESNSGKSSFTPPPTFSIGANKSVSSKSEIIDETQEIVSTEGKTESFRIDKQVENRRSSMRNAENKTKEANAHPAVKAHSASKTQAKKTSKQETPLSKTAVKVENLDSAEETKKTKGITTSKQETTSTSKKITPNKKLECSDSGRKLKDRNSTGTGTFSSDKTAKNVKVESSKDAKKTKDVNTTPKNPKHISSPKNSDSRRSGKVEAAVTKKKSQQVFNGKKIVSSNIEVDKKKTKSQSDLKNSAGNLRSARASVKTDQNDDSKKKKHVRVAESSLSKKTSAPTHRRRH